MDHRRAFLNLDDAVVDLLASFKYWGTRADVRKRISNGVQNFVPGVGLFRLDVDEQESALFLAIALRHLADADEFHDGDHVDELCRYVCYSLKSLNASVLGTELHDVVKEALHAVAAILRTRFYRIAETDVDARLHAPVTLFLNAALELKVKWGTADLFASLFSDWLNCESSAESSAGLLVFLLFVRTEGDYRRIYRESTVLDAAFSKPLCRRHWNIGAECLNGAVSRDYFDRSYRELVATSREDEPEA